MRYSVNFHSASTAKGKWIKRYRVPTVNAAVGLDGHRECNVAFETALPSIRHSTTFFVDGKRLMHTSAYPFTCMLYGAEDLEGVVTRSIACNANITCALAL